MKSREQGYNAGQYHNPHLAPSRASCLVMTREWPVNMCTMPISLEDECPPWCSALALSETDRIEIQTQGLHRATRLMPVHN